MASQEEIKKELSGESSKNSITNKLLEFQKRVSAISKDSVNPFFKSKYFDVNTVIDTIKPVLNDIGLVVTQPFGISDAGKNVLYTQVWDDGKLVIASGILIPEVADIQKFGAALTYLRRYALVSLLLLQGEEDDDGNTVVKSKAPAKQKTSNSEAESQELMKQSMDEFEGAPRSIKPISQKQAWLIKSLYTQFGIEPMSDEFLRQLTSQQASDLIKKIKGEV